MSREFSWSSGGYMHSNIRVHAEDCVNGDDRITKVFAELLFGIQPIAYGVCSVEAGDANEVEFYVTRADIDKARTSLDRISNLLGYEKPYPERSVMKRCIVCHKIRFDEWGGCPDDCIGWGIDHDAEQQVS